MKERNIKLMLVLLGLGTLCFLAGLFIYSTKADLEPFHYIAAATVLIAVLISTLIGLQRLKELKQGLPIEDEMSLRIVEKSAARTFLYSLYIWFFMMIFTVDKGISSEGVIGTGLLASGVIFFINWVYLTRTGMNEDEN